MFDFSARLYLCLICLALDPDIAIYYCLSLAFVSVAERCLMRKLSPDSQMVLMLTVKVSLHGVASLRPPPSVSIVITPSHHHHLSPTSN